MRISDWSSDVCSSDLTTRLEDEGWRYDRWHDCWRAPGEEIRKPSWSLPEADLRRREAALAAIVPSSAECRLKIMNEKNEVLHDVVRVSSDGEAAWGEFRRFHSAIDGYLKATGLIHGHLDRKRPRLNSNH